VFVGCGSAIASGSAVASGCAVASGSVVASGSAIASGCTAALLHQEICSHACAFLSFLLFSIILLPSPLCK
jgi:hypothetical protein